MRRGQPQAEGQRIPLPRPTHHSAPHWDDCRDGRLRFQRCSACGNAEFPPQPACTACHSEALEWSESSGRGRIYSLTTVHRPQRPEFEAPYTVAIIELEEGWMMLSNVIDCDPDELRIDMPVVVEYRHLSEEITLPYFRPA